MEYFERPTIKPPKINNKIKTKDRVKIEELERYLKGISDNPDNMGNHIRAKEALKD
jgi:hypothetical protein